MPAWKEAYGAPLWEKSVRKSPSGFPSSQLQLVPLVDLADQTLSAFLFVRQQGLYHEALFVKRDSLGHLLGALGMPDSQNEADTILAGFGFLVECHLSESGFIEFRCSPPDQCYNFGTSFWKKLSKLFTNLSGGGSNGGGGTTNGGNTIIGGGVTLPTWFPPGGSGNPLPPWR
jgi:hypothetical protein